MHPAEEIYCESSSKLKGRTIVMGITGSVAAVECFGAIRELIRHGAKVIPVLTESARDFVTPLSMEYASGNTPVTELTGATEHVSIIGSDADVLLIYPATANTISKIANGIDDTPVTSMATVALGSGLPIAIAPAMHDAMFKNPAVQKNIELLRSWGVTFIGPKKVGPRAKVASKEEVIASVFRLLSKDDLAGKRILVIGGRSEEPIDSMRIITNRSTGLMAVRIADRAMERGADVELWMGGCSVPIPDYMNVRRFDSVSDLISMIDSIDRDIVIVPAALSDFTPAERRNGKISSKEGFDLELEPVPKVLPLLSKRCKYVIGFKAESGLSEDELVRKAKSRMDEYGLYAIVANDIDSAGKTSSSAIIITSDGNSNITGPKDNIADSILDQCSRIA